MLTAIKSYYENGKIILSEEAPVKEKTEVMVTFPTEERQEMLPKRKLGISEDKLTTPDDFNEPLEDLKDYMQWRLPFIYWILILLEEHRDPFDRSLIAIATHENAVLLPADTHFNLYPEFVRIMLPFRNKTGFSNRKQVLEIPL